MTQAGNSAGIKMLAVDDHPVVVEGIAALIQRAAPEIDMIGIARNRVHLGRMIGEMHLASDHRTVVLYDLNLADGSDPNAGIRFLERMNFRVVVLTCEIRPIPLRAALEAGAHGVALKCDAVSSIVEVIRAVHKGESAASSDTAFALLTDDSLAPRLSEREIEVLQLLADGVPRKAVGARLDPPVELATVATYLNRIFKKYEDIGRDVRTFPDAIREARRDGYLLEDYSPRPVPGRPFRGSGGRWLGHPHPDR